MPEAYGGLGPMDGLAYAIASVVVGLYLVGSPSRCTRWCSRPNRCRDLGAERAAHGVLAPVRRGVKLAGRVAGVLGACCGARTARPVDDPARWAAAVLDDRARERRDRPPFRTTRPRGDRAGRTTDSAAKHKRIAFIVPTDALVAAVGAKEAQARHPRVVDGQPDHGGGARAAELTCSAAPRRASRSR